MVSEYKKLFGSGPVSIVIIILMSAVVLAIEGASGLGRITPNIYSALLAALLLVAGLLVAIYSFVSLPLSERGKHVVMQGVYKYVRHRYTQQ